MIRRLQHTIHTTEYALLFRTVTRGLWIGCAVLFVGYLYFVGAITFSVVERQALEEKKKTLASDISTLELTYLAQEKLLTKEFGYSMGLVDAKTVAFTTVKRAVAWNGSR